METFSLIVLVISTVILAWMSGYQKGQMDEWRRVKKRENCCDNNDWSGI